MPHPIDVGSVLGGRYKVTATVLTSHDQDLVLDGVDQVLNRPVSILVAGPDNADQVAQSAREVAIGERPGNVQILDLGVSDATTYLITSQTSAPDLLDLAVAANPPYVEPFFTDTLGSEIFGQARSNEPETYDDEDDVNAGFIKYGDNRAGQVDPHPAAAPSLPPRRPERPTSAPSAAPRSATAGALAAGAAGAGVSGAAASPSTAPQAATPPAVPSQYSTAPQPVQPESNASGQSASTPADSPRDGGGTGSEAPKVSLWSDEDYTYAGDDQQDQHAAASQDKDRSQTGRPAGSFPAFARATTAPAAEDYDDDDDDEPEKEPRSTRWLVGGLLAAVLIAGLVFAVTNLGTLFNTEPEPSASAVPSSSSQPPTGEPSATQSSPPVSGPPSIEGITRLGNFDFAGTYDADLGKVFDGNAASYWSDMEFATDDWGGLATEGVPLAVKLKNPSLVSSITLSQLAASGGNISVYTNDRPALEGAKLVGTNSFTSTDLTMPLAEPVTAQYVIVSIKNLPKLASPKTRYGYGLRLAEIKVQ